MAMAGKITVAEVEHLVPAGELDLNQIHTPGIFVQRIFKGGFTKKELKTKQQPNRKMALTKNEIAKRIAQELVNNTYVNLGIGIPL